MRSRSRDEARVYQHHFWQVFGHADKNAPDAPTIKMTLGALGSAPQSPPIKILSESMHLDQEPLRTIRAQARRAEA